MAYEDLLKSVEESAQEKERALRSRAAASVREIEERAKAQAGEIRKGHLAEAEKSTTAERNKLLYITRAENKELLIRTREDAFELAFREAEERLNGIRSDTKYPAVFEKLLAEAARALEGEVFVLHIDRRDEALCTATLKKLGIACQVQADLTTAGGVVASLPDDTVVIANTIESRLQQAKERRRQEIHAILSGA